MARTKWSQEWPGRCSKVNLGRLPCDSLLAPSGRSLRQAAPFWLESVLPYPWHHSLAHPQASGANLGHPVISNILKSSTSKPCCQQCPATDLRCLTVMTNHNLRGGTPKNITPLMKCGDIGTKSGPCHWYQKYLSIGPMQGNSLLEPAFEHNSR